MRALISVSDKTGIVELAEELQQLGFELLSTGGTAKKLREAEISVQEVSEFTGFPEILGGRVKTLHPKIFGGILFNRENPNHQSEIRNQEIPPIDWVVANLYPFEKIMLEDKISKEEMLEFIDIGGVALLRAAAKNFKDVVVLCDPSDYLTVLEEYKKNKRENSGLRQNDKGENDKSFISIQTRKNLAAKAFAHTACYDSMIAKFFRELPPLSLSHSLRSPPIEMGGYPKGENLEGGFPEEFPIGLRKVCNLRYGENPQQKAALYKHSGQRNWGVVDAEKLQGKELSFNNYLDLDSAWQVVNSISSYTGSRPLRVGYKDNAKIDSRVTSLGEKVCCAIIKHTNPCAVALGKTSLEAFTACYQADSLSAFGGIVGFSSTVDEATAQEICKSFFECIIAPEYENKALEIFKKKPNLRVLKQPVSLALPYELDIKKVSGGILLQERDWEPPSSSPSPLKGEGMFLDTPSPTAGNLSDRFVAEGGSERKKSGWKIVTKRSPTPEEMLSLEFAWNVCRFVKSNAIVLSRGTVTCGIGAGQMSRIDALRIAIRKSLESSELRLETKSSDSKLLTLNAQRSTLNAPQVMASDAFFPFRDCVDEAAKAGISAIVQPGGSIRDAESIDAANQHNIAMIFTGVRHFKH